MRKTIIILLTLFFIAKSSFSITKTANNFTVSAEFPGIVNESEFTFPVRIANLENESRTVEVYSYVYRDKSVSGAWTDNKLIIRLEPFESKSLNLTNELNEVNGLYSIKLRVRDINDMDVDLKAYININQTLKNSEVTGYSIMKPVAYGALSILGLGALFLVMRKL